LSTSQRNHHRLGGRRGRPDLLTEQALLTSGVIPADTIPLFIQDRTFVPNIAQMAAQDPTWDYSRWGKEGDFKMQRVAIARALVNCPEILMADEPTGNLDTKRSGEIGEILLDLNRNTGLTIVMVSHNPELARLGGRVVEMRDGKQLLTIT
jgi:ABC-type iron transport system FetAB ATPase subunit